MIPAQKDRVFGLDLLRATAIWLVLWSHAILCFGLSADTNELPHYLGLLGVHLFFVLSGFLVGGIWLRELERSPDSPPLRRFLVRRWMRTFPNYYLFVGVNYALAEIYSDGLTDPQYYLLFLQCWTWPITAMGNTVFMESWTLSIEEWFYLLFPLSVIPFRRYLGVRGGFFAAAIAFLLVPATLRLFALPAPFVYKSPTVVTSLDAIALGALLAVLKISRPDLWRMAIYTWPLSIAVVAIPVSLLTYGWSPASKLEQFVYMSLPPFAAFFALPALDRIRVESSLGTIAVELTSLWSYALYLVHLPLALVMVSEGAVRWSLQFGRLAPLIVVSGYIGGSFVISAALYYAYERPMTNLRERFS